MSHSDFQGGIKLPSKYENIDDSDFKFINEKIFITLKTYLYFTLLKVTIVKKTENKTRLKKTQKDTGETLRSIGYVYSLDPGDGITGYCICPNLSKCTY